MEQPLKIERCPSCHRILGEFALRPGSKLRIKCSCNCWFYLQVVMPDADLPSERSSRVVALRGL